MMETDNRTIRRVVRQLISLIEVGHHAPPNDYRLVEGRELMQALVREKGHRQ